MTSDELVSHVTGHAVELRRRLLSNYYHDMFSGKIQQGPLKGFPVERAPKWGTGDVASKLFGLYEQEVLTIVESCIGRKTILVNLGAADGYYGIGLIATNNFPRSVCYELSDEGKSSIEKCALEHAVSDRVLLFGAASNQFPADLKRLGLAVEDMLVLCDVEGAEFEIFDENCLKNLEGSEVIIELHEFMVQNGADNIQSLFDRARRHFDVRLFKTGYRDLSGIPELDGLGDSDRWLICSEGRSKMMSWMHLTSRS
jgi:hypothetical protein